MRKEYFLILFFYLMIVLMIYYSDIYEGTVYKSYVNEYNDNKNQIVTIIDYSKDYSCVNLKNYSTYEEMQENILPKGQVVRIKIVLKGEYCDIEEVSQTEQTFLYISVGAEFLLMLIVLALKD